MTLILWRAKVILSVLGSKFKNKFIQNKLASFAILGALLPVSISPALNVEEEIISNPNPNIVLNTESPMPVDLVNKTSVVLPGESLVEKEARLALEAKQKAEAEERAKVLAQAEASKRNTVTRERRVYNDPSDFDQIYARAEAAYGVDARILKAVHTVETGRSGSTLRSNPSGATGPMQFLPSTWRRHGVDGNGDGVADIGNVEDAIFSAAQYLKACGYPNVQKALWGYNPSSRYYTKVMGVAQSFGF